MMNMQKRQRIALWTVRLLGIVSVLLLALFFSGACPRWFVGRGDLFRLTSAKQFEELVADPYHVDESVQTAPLDSGIVWWLGDSFSRVQFGHKPLPEEVSDMLSVAGLGKVAAVDYIDIQGSPKKLFALAAARAAAKRPFPKVIVLECVERNFFVNLGQHTIFDYGNVAPWDEGRGTSSTVKRLRRRAFLEAPGTVDFKLRRFPPVAAIRKWNDTWRYALYGDEHPGAPAFKGARPRLVFSEDVAGLIRESETESEYGAVLKNLANLDSLAKTFGARLLFVMPPNRENMWTPGAGYPQYERLYAMLDSAGIENVNLVPPFLAAINVGEDVYWKTDSHWNGRAHRIASDLITRKLQEMLR